MLILTVMALIPLIALIVALILLANWLALRNDATLNTAFDRMMLLGNLPLFLGGIALTLLPESVIELLGVNGELPLVNFPGAGLSLVLMGGLALLASLRSVRQWLARWMPLNPDSPVHTLALVFSGYLGGNTLLTLTQGGLEEMALAAEAANINDLVIQQALFVVLALFGTGLLVRRNSSKLSERLGLQPISKAHILLGLRWIGILVILQWAAGALWAWLAPEQIELVESISSELFGEFGTVWDWFVLSISAGMGEEILFRGALQPVFGIWFTSLLFAVAHVQYGLTPVTLVVFIIGLALGRIRQRTNTSVAIFVHFGYNFVLGLLTLLVAYLEPLVNNGGF